MPTFIHGKEAFLELNGTDISIYTNTVTPSFKVDTADTSTFGVDSKQFIGGLKENTFTFDGLFDVTVDALLEGILAVFGTAWVYGPGGNGAGLSKWSGVGV